MKHAAWWVLPIAALAGACAGVPRDDSKVSTLEHYLAYAGDPVDRFSYPQRLRGWHPVDREHLYVRTGPGSAYLLTLTGGCVGLQTTLGIGLTSHAGRGIVTSGLDEVIIERDRCRIVAIRPLDYDRMQADKQAGQE
jgi:hypothetical protein